MQNLAEERFEDETVDVEAGNPIIIVGTGPVGVRVAEQLVEHSPSCSIVIYGDEPWEPYNRVRLSSLLAGEIGQDALLNIPKITQQGSVTAHYNCSVVSIDREAKTITDSERREQPYEALVLATGSRPHIPSISGIDIEGVYTFRDMNDVQGLMARRVRSRRTVVLGGGLLGLEAARAMQRSNTEVVVVEHAPRLMARQLDDAASELLREHVMSMGLQVILGNGVKVIMGDEQVEGILLRSGRVIDCDTIIVATGINPNIELALDAHLKVGRGIMVDDTMQTSDPSIYAAGECVEHRNRVYGLVAPGLEQAAVAAHAILKGKSHYIGSSSTSRLKVLDIDVFSAGKVGEEFSELTYKPYIYESSSNGIYRKLIICHNRLVGAIVVGGWSELNRLQEMIDNERRIWPWQMRRFMRTGMIWPEEEAASVVDWPVSAVVCSCTGVTRGVLGTALSQGCNSIETLCQKTGASGVCGSCKPLLAELVGAEPVVEKQTGRKALAISSIAALLAFFVFVLLPRLVPENSVQDPLYQISILWRDGFWKQVSGFTLLGLSVLGLVVSMRKRLKFFSFGSFGLWRLVHTILGLTALLTLVVHTGFAFGQNINAMLMANFLAIAIVGSLAGFAVVFEDRRRGLVGKKIRRWSNQAHLWITWPLPALLGFHILSVYYF